MTVVNGTIWASFLKQENNAIVLDVRSPKEWNKGVLFDAIPIDIDDPIGFEDFLRPLDKNLKYYVYSKSGKRGEIACTKMEAMGFLETINLHKGLMGYYLKADSPFWNFG